MAGGLTSSGIRQVPRLLVLLQYSFFGEGLVRAIQATQRGTQVLVKKGRNPILRMLASVKDRLTANVIGYVVWTGSGSVYRVQQK